MPIIQLMRTTPIQRTQILFNAQNTTRANDNTMTIFTSAEGAAGSKVSIFKSALLSALTVKQDRSLAVANEPTLVEGLESDWDQVNGSLGKHS